jgi:hypothetical protein
VKWRLRNRPRPVDLSGIHAVEVSWLFALFSLEDITMDSLSRLQLVGRVTYYLGWVAAVCGGLVHLTIGTALFRAITLSKRNLLEISIFFFIVAAASELRALVLVETGAVPSGARKQAA